MLSVDHFIEIFDRCDLETLRQASLVCREFENIIFGNMRLCKKFKIVLDPNKVVPNKDLSIFMPNIKVLRDTNRPYKQLRIKNINTWMTTNKQRELTGVLTKLGKSNLHN